MIPKVWDNEEVWILGGGPSVASSFNIPEEVVKAVQLRLKPMSVYGKYIKALKSKHVIGINVAYRIADWIDIIFMGDKGFLMNNRTSLKEYPGMKVSCHSIAERPEYNWVKYVPKDGRKPQGITSHPMRISWNLNSGAAAISLAVRLGAKRIILVGFDMNVQEGRQHFHDEYNKGKVETDKQRRGLPFRRHLMGFPAIKIDVDKLGIEIINTSLNSSITQFKKIPVKDLL